MTQPSGPGPYDPVDPQLVDVSTVDLPAARQRLGQWRQVVIDEGREIHITVSRQARQELR